MRSVRVQFVQGSYVSRAIHYFIPSLVALGRGIKSTHENRVSVLNCLGFDLASDYTDIIPNTV